jgi:Ca2+-binding EF-hand superfamily protein
MVRSVSEDKLYDTIEFNEFLRMMSKQREEEVNMDTLVEAFRYYDQSGTEYHSVISRIFDKDKDGFLTTDELGKMMKSKMAKKDLEIFVKEADADNDGLIDCKGKILL